MHVYGIWKDSADEPTPAEQQQSHRHRGPGLWAQWGGERMARAHGNTHATICQTELWGFAADTQSSAQGCGVV